MRKAVQGGGQSPRRRPGPSGPRSSFCHAAALGSRPGKSCPAYEDDDIPCRSPRPRTGGSSVLDVAPCRSARPWMGGSTVMLPPRNQLGLVQNSPSPSDSPGATLSSEQRMAQPRICCPAWLSEQWGKRRARGGPHCKGVGSGER